MEKIANYFFNAFIKELKKTSVWGWDRTTDLMINSHALNYQLSYPDVAEDFSPLSP